MTPEEKISQMVKWAPPIPRLGIDGYNYRTEAAHGIVTAGTTCSNI